MKKLKNILNHKLYIPYRVSKLFFTQQKKAIMKKIQVEENLDMPKSIPYSTESSFFHKQKKSILNKIQLNEKIDVKTNIPYKGSYNYFPKLSQSILRKIVRAENKPQFTFIRKRIISVVSIASVFIFLFASYWFYDNAKTSTSEITKTRFTFSEDILEQDLNVILKTELAEDFQICLAPSIEKDGMCWEHNDCFEDNEDLVTEIINNISIMDIMCEH